jgi:hypothetical protein
MPSTTSCITTANHALDVLTYTALLPTAGYNVKASVGGHYTILSRAGQWVMAYLQTNTLRIGDLPSMPVRVKGAPPAIWI